VLTRAPGRPVRGNHDQTGSDRGGLAWLLGPLL
jgi:hypothetical protein